MHVNGPPWTSMDVNGGQRRQWTELPILLQVLGVFRAAEIICIAPAFGHPIFFSVIKISGAAEVISVSPGLAALEVQEQRHSF